MTPSLRQTTLEASRLAVEFDRAVATGSEDIILAAASKLDRAVTHVAIVIHADRTKALASYDHGRAEGFEAQP